MLSLTMTLPAKNHREQSEGSTIAVGVIIVPEVMFSVFFSCNGFFEIIFWCHLLTVVLFSICCLRLTTVTEKEEMRYMSLRACVINQFKSSCLLSGN